MAGVTPHTVALIDDDAPVRKALARLLRSAGFTVTTFESAEEFLARSAEPVPDCLVLDVNLTGMSGMELSQTLAERGAAIATVFITAGDDARTRDMLTGAGVRRWLRKPIDRSTLIEAIRHAIPPAVNE
jgi:FixJ family two-component response regulator